MTKEEFRAYLRDLRARAARSRPAIFLMLGLFALAAVYPSDMEYYSNAAGTSDPAVKFVNRYGRHVNTAAMALLPVVLGDKLGFAQAVCSVAASTAATHSLKYLLNGVVINGTRLGQRPYGRDSGSNMPSGHSSLAAVAMMFVARRYGRRHLWYLAPVTGLAMAARVLLKAHTLSAVIAGCVLGILAAYLFTTPRSNAEAGAARPG